MSQVETDSLQRSKEESADEGPQEFAGVDLERELGPASDNEIQRYESNAQLSREITRKLSGVDKIFEDSASSNEPIPPMGGGKEIPPKVGALEDYAVSYDGPKDPLHPHNWPTRKKMLTCFVVGMFALSSTLGSAFFAAASEGVQKNYHVGSVVATLGTSLYVFGFASGPIVWGPLSELYGRGVVLLPCAFGFTCFAFAIATGKDIQTILICRFFCGFIGAAPLVVAPAAMADVFNNEQRGKAISIFAMIVFGGPMLAPIFGAFTAKNPHLGWRWCSYFYALTGVLTLLCVTFLYEETHHEIILVGKAEKIRRRTGNWAIHAPHEEISLSMKEICEENILRPIKMLVTEPIIFLVTLYNSFIYGLLYLFLTAIPMIFGGKYGWPGGVAELPYLSMLIGIFLGAYCCYLFEGRYIKAMRNNNNKPVPEERLPPMMIGGLPFALGIFWMGWTGAYAEHVHWIVPVIGIAFIGFGLITIFLPCMNYIVDCYLLFAASALAANTFMRSMFGGAFPLFARQMFQGMKIQYASTLLGCVALVLVPVPFAFYKYGKQVRQKSKFAFVL